MKVYTADEFMTQSNVHVFKIAHNESVPVHTHEFIEIVYILSGKMSQMIDGQCYEVSHGDVIFMNCGCTHSFTTDNNYSYVNILLSADLIEDSAYSKSNIFSIVSLTAFNEMCGEANFGRISFFGKERKEIDELVFAMLSEYDNKQISWDIVLGNYLNTFIIKLLRKTQAGMDRTEIDGMWKSLAEYIEENLQSKLTLSDLAEQCFYNPSYFSRVFKEKFNMTLTEYVTRKRLDHAIELLSSTDLTVGEISAKVGFSDRVSFYHAFSRYLNKTPMHYRKK